MDGTERIPVNDGHGLYDNLGLIDTIIVDCNEITSLISQGRWVAYCAKIVGMVQKLSNLKEGVEKDLQSRDETIADLRRLIDEDKAVSE